MMLKKIQNGMSPVKWSAIAATCALSVAMSTPCVAAQGGEIQIGLSTKAWFPSFVAELTKQQGYFKAQGVSAEITVYQSGSEALTAIAAGAADLISTNPSIVSDGRRAGVDVKLVSLLATRNYGWQIVLPTKTPVSTIADLKGRNVGITSAGSNTDLLAHWTMKKYGITFKTVPLGGGGLIPNLISGNVDAIVVYPPLSYKATLGGDGKMLIDFGTEMPEHFEAGWGASEKYIKNHGDTLKRAVAALLQGVAYIKAHPDDVIPRIAKYDGVSEDVAKKDYEETFKALSEDGVMNAKLVTEALSLFPSKEKGAVPKADDLFTNAFVGAGATH
jgi:NitT/TauT family transport system substrate-binding protein